MPKRSWLDGSVTDGRRFAAGMSTFVVLLAGTLEASADPGETVYQQKCSACHDSGAGDAPRVGVSADWPQRFSARRAAVRAVPGIRSVDNRLITGGMLDFD